MVAEGHVSRTLVHCERQPPGLELVIEDARPQFVSDIDLPRDFDDRFLRVSRQRIEERRIQPHWTDG